MEKLNGSTTSPHQSKILKKTYREGGTRYHIKATIRWDDECKNGYNTFAVTADVIEQAKNGRWIDGVAGCCHTTIAKQFPEIAHLIKWHGCGPNGPIGYVENTIYMAGDRDCWGGRKGEPRYTDFYVTTENGAVICKDDFRGAPVPKKFPTRAAASRMANTIYGYVREHTWEFHKGKMREFDAARRIAIWPEATDKMLSAKPETLRKHLEARLDKLVAEMRKDIEALGFVW